MSDDEYFHLKESKKVNNEIKAFCSTCGQETYHHVLHAVEAHWGNEAVHGKDDNQIIQCKGCKSISFRVERYFSEAQGEAAITLFPERSRYDYCPQSLAYLPDSISKIYQETIRCFNMNLNILCAIGIRAILEGICLDKKIHGGFLLDSNENPLTDPDGNQKRKNKGLQGKIYGLAEHDIITKKNRKCLHQIRFLGNEAAHELLEPSKNELKLALNIIDNVIETLYVIPDVASDLETTSKKRQNKDKSCLS